MTPPRPTGHGRRVGIALLLLGATLPSSATAQDAAPAPPSSDAPATPDQTYGERVDPARPDFPRPWVPEPRAATGASDPDALSIPPVAAPVLPAPPPGSAAASPSDPGGPGAPPLGRWVWGPPNRAHLATPDYQIRVPPDACWDPRDHPDAYRRPQDALPTDRCKRDLVELVELYIWAGAFGLGTGALVTDLLGVEDGGAGSVAAMLAATGTILAVYGFDHMHEHRLLPGMPGAVSTGILLGFFEGFVAWGAFGGAIFTDRSARFMWGATAAGALVGSFVGLTLRPTPADNALVRSGAIWGVFLAQMANLATNADDDLDIFRVLFTGYNAGIIGAAMLSGVVELSRMQVLYMDLGGLIGAMAGALILSPMGRDVDDSTIGLSVGVSTLGGMALALLLSVPAEAEPMTEPAVADAVDHFSVYATPVDDGVVVGAAALF